MRYLFTWEIKDYISEIEKKDLNPIDCFYVKSYNDLQQSKEIYEKLWIEYKIIRINQPYLNELTHIKEIIKKEYWNLTREQIIKRLWKVRFTNYKEN